LATKRFDAVEVVVPDTGIDPGVMGSQGKEDFMPEAAGPDHSRGRAMANP